MAEKPRPWWKQAPASAPAETASAVTPAAVPTGSANDLADGESREVQGSGAKPYVLKNTAGVYSCTCPAWMHLGIAIERRTCKHLAALRGAEAESARVGGPPVRAATPATASSSNTSTTGDVAPPLLLAHKWEHDVDLSGWWMSEKLDGVRAYWDGSRLVSRLGNVFWAPEWFTAALPPDLHLDGELFGGRRKFQRTVSIVRRQDRSDAAWREISYVIFDAPRFDGPFEERLRAVRELLARTDATHLVAHEHVPCRDLPHLREELARVEGLGGEGLMMRKPASRYESGRSSTLLKVKTFHDAEAVVVAHLPGAGKHKGRLGALECDLADGTRFSVGTGLSDAERDRPPPIGAVITFRYQELTTDGVPRFPSYVGIRDDVAFQRTTPAPAATPATSAARPAAPAPAPRAAPTPIAAPAPTAAPAPSGAATTSTTRDARIFVRDGVVWQITLSGNAHTIRQARGEAIETITATFRGGASAWRDADARIASQIAEGWTEVDPD